MVVAPHGGGIEPGTSEIAEAIAGQDFSLYCFEGTKRRGNRDLHVTSTCFDDPQCVQLIERSETVVAIHGLTGSREAIYVGGLDEALKTMVIKALRRAGFTAIEDITHHSGRNPQNICNRGTSGRGLQIEITRALRRTMFGGLTRRGRQTVTTVFDEFVSTMGKALAQILEERKAG